jgi:hypothetical protein
VDVSASAVGQVSVRRGRDSVYAQADAGYASVELIDPDLSMLEVGEGLSVALDDSAGDPVTVFTGLVSDWRLGVRQRFEGDPVTVVSLQAVGPLAKMSRRQGLTGGRPVEDDGERVAAAVSQGLGLAWEETPFYDWDAVGTAVTWATFDPDVDLTLIDTGSFDLVALPAADGGYGVLSVAQDAAFSGQGILYETAGGLIGYANRDARPDSLGSALSVPVAQVAADSLLVSSSLADVANRVFVSWGTASDAEKVDDTWSIIEYGVQSQTFSTQLADETDANVWADDYLLRHASPRVELPSVTINLLSVGTALRDSLLTINTNDPLALTGVPNNVLLDDFLGFVEGVEITADRFRADLNLFISDSTLSVGGTRWGQVSATLAWSSVGSAVIWSAYDA